MAEEEILAGERTWFFDPRSRLRRLGVATHPDQGVVVLSLWTGDRCTGTFRLPTADAGRLISTLADGLVSSLPGIPTAAVVAAPRGWRAWVARIRRRPAQLADVIHLRSVK